MNRNRTFDNMVLPILICYCIVLPVGSPIITVICLAVLMLWYFINKCRSIKLEVFILISCLIINIVLLYLFHPRYATLSGGFSAGGSTGSVDVLNQSVRYVVYLLIGIMLYEAIFYTANYERIEKVISNSLIVLVILFWILKLFQMYNSEVYYSVRNLFFGTDINLTGNEALRLGGYFDRYSFIFLDPNNCGYCMLTVCCFLFEHCKNKIIKIICLMTAIATPIFTGSRGTLVALLLYVVIVMFRGKSKTQRLFAIAFSFLSVILLFGIVFGDEMIFLNIGSNISMRGINFFDDSRLSIWKNVIETFKIPPIIGNGYCLISDGVFVRPHSDILRLLYGYGIIYSFALFSFLFKGGHFKKGKFHLLDSLLPVLVAICLNSVIDEPRFLYLAFILLAFLSIEAKNVSAEHEEVKYKNE